MELADESDPRSWFGFARIVDEGLSRIAIRELRDAWINQTGVGPDESLSEDLELLRQWFDPLSTGTRLRKEPANLGAVDRTGLLAEPFLVSTGDSVLVSPEGRILLHLLERATIRNGQAVVAIDDLRSAQLALLLLYRLWCQKRLRDVIDLRIGKGAPLLPQAAGQVLLLLANGSVDSDHPLRRPKEPSEAAMFDEATATAIASFADTLAPPSGRQRHRTHYSLYGGYARSEARRRLGEALVVDRGQSVTYLDGDESEIQLRVSAELAKRRGFDPDQLRMALDAFRDAYVQARPILASFGQAYSPRSQVDRVCASILETTQKLVRDGRK